jgi:hypothetical protein
LAKHKSELGIHDSFEDMSREDASNLIATMCSNYGEPKKGTDAERHEENPDERHEHENPHTEGSDTEGPDQDGGGSGESGDGKGDGSGEGNGDGDGDGEGDGDGNGDGKDKPIENPYREGSKEQIIAQALIENDLDAQKTYEQLKDKIGQKPLEFKQNTGEGGRVPLPLGEDTDKSSDKTQKGRTRKTINDVRKQLLDQNPQEGEGGGNGGGGNDKRPMYEPEMLLQQLNEIRKICEDLSADGEPFDSIGMRPYVHGPKMLGAGFPRKAIIDSMTMSYPVEVRKTINEGKKMPEYDHRRIEKEKDIPPMPVEKIDEYLTPLAEKTKGGKSPYLPAMVRLAQAGVPILQIGEKGTGKTTNAEHLAEALAEIRGREMPFGFASMTSGTSPGEFKGRITLHDFLPSLFEKIFSGGGVFLFDEMDAGDPNLLTLLNSALANGYFVNQKGQKIVMSDDFVGVAAMNTMGMGATSRYTGRNRLDSATLDRWAMGRMRVDFDQDLAEMLFWSEVKKATV